MLRLISLLALFLSTSVFAHEAQLVTQHIKSNKQNESAWQFDALAKAVLNPKFQFGLHGSYLERFDLYEKRAGAFAFFNLSDTLTIEARYLKGESGVEIFAKDHYAMTVYHSLGAGFSPYITYLNSLYEVVHLQMLRLGIEIEKFRNIIIIPQVMIGQAQFNDPGEVKEVNNFGLKVIYYVEQQYSFSAFAYKGTEAAQVIVGRSNQVIETKTAGASASYYFIPDLRSEIVFDYTDLGELDNQFLTTTLNLVWAF